MRDEPAEDAETIKRTRVVLREKREERRERRERKIGGSKWFTAL